jgi:hypothetical protein
MHVGMVVSDLDGTLLDSSHRLSTADRETLVELGRRGVIRVVATGRSLFSARRVLAEDFPIDFLAHSSGAGIVSWPVQRSVRAVHMTPCAATGLARELSARGLDFMLHRAIPDNHHFYAHESGRDNVDFERRYRLYAEYAEELRTPFTSDESMCQAIVIDPPPRPGSLAELRAALPKFQIIRTTSPLDGKSTWIEIFPIGVGKAIAASWLREREGCRGSACVAVGNDYNDLDLLDWADLPFVVSNAPDELRSRYSTVASNDANGFTEAVRKALT